MKIKNIIKIGIMSILLIFGIWSKSYAAFPDSFSFSNVKDDLYAPFKKAVSDNVWSYCRNHARHTYKFALDGKIKYRLARKTTMNTITRKALVKAEEKGENFVQSVVWYLNKDRIKGLGNKYNYKPLAEATSSYSEKYVSKQKIESFLKKFNSTSNDKDANDYSVTVDDAEIVSTDKELKLNSGDNKTIKFYEIKVHAEIEGFEKAYISVYPGKDLEKISGDNKYTTYHLEGDKAEIDKGGVYNNKRIITTSDDKRIFIPCSEVEEWINKGSNCFYILIDTHTEEIKVRSGSIGYYNPVSEGDLPAQKMLRFDFDESSDKVKETDYTFTEISSPPETQPIHIKYIQSIKDNNGNVKASTDNSGGEQIPLPTVSGNPKKMKYEQPILFVFDGYTVTYGIRIYSENDETAIIQDQIVDIYGEGLEYQSIENAEVDTIEKDEDNEKYTKLIINPPIGKEIKGNEYYDIYITFKVNLQGKSITELTNEAGNEVTIYVPEPIPPPEGDISGTVFIDKKDITNGKVTKEGNGLYDAGIDGTAANVKVELLDVTDDAEGIVVRTQYTDSNGGYAFNNVTFKIYIYHPTLYGYWIETKYKYYKVKFTYNGQEYENVRYYPATNTGSFAKEDDTDRVNLNNQFKTIDKSNSGLYSLKDNTKKNVSYTGNNFGITACTVERIGEGTSWRQTANLGLVKREFDLSLENRLDSMDVSINGVNQRLYSDYGGVISETLLNQDVYFKESDYNYKGNNELSVWVNYKITVKNESPDDFIGYLNSINFYYDSRFDNIQVNVNGNSIENIQGATGFTGKKIKFNKIPIYNVAGKEAVIDIRVHLSRETIAYCINSDDLMKTFETIAEIESYSTDYNGDIYNNGHTGNAGKIDEDSDAGNLNMSEYVSSVRKSTDPKTIFSFFNKEDDARRALGIKLKTDTTPRKLTGFVFEDATEKTKKDAKGNNIGEDQYTRLGNGKYDSAEKKIEGAIVTLYDGDKVAYHYEGKTTATTDSNRYTLEGFIPSANYHIEITYGDGKTYIYNAQDYKSTIDTTGNSYNGPVLNNGNAPDGANNYWYTQVENYSVAKDKDVKMTSRQLTNQTATLLENYSHVYGNTASTKTIFAPIRWLGNTRTNEEKDYNITNINLGLAERPRSELTINKEVDHINITATDGTTLIDGTQGAKSVSWTDRYVQPIVDANLIYGSTLTITYKIIITNTGEVDYKSENRRFYDYGIKEGNTITTKPEIVIDYVDNNLVYNDNTPLYNEVNVTNSKYWQEVTDSEIAELLDDNIESNVAKVNCKIETLSDSPLVNKALKPGESNQVYLALTKTLSDANNEDLLTYNNYVEILQSTNTAGRRSYHTTEILNDYVKDKVTLIGNYNNLLLSDVENRGAPVDMETENRKKFLVLSIPGDFDPVTLSTLYWEPDTDCAEEVQVIQPFGSTTAQKIIIWTSIAIASGIVLAGGIYLIKKRVLDK